MPLASVVIRTLNEEKYLSRVLESVRNQKVDGEVEIVLVDSGSTDQTLEIAARYGCHILRILKQDFTFGRSLNVGCRAATGDYLVFISGHCIPASDAWLSRLLTPFSDPGVALTYGRQIGAQITRFSEHQIFSRYFPADHRIRRPEFFCNNANAAVRRSFWLDQPYDEDLTGLEDMDWAKKILLKGYRIEYAVAAVVVHIHEETWRSVRLRYEREAIALQRIMPEIHVYFSDFLRYFASATLSDWARAVKRRVFLKEWLSIVLFRFFQYYGSYRGNHEHRKLSKEMRERYFFPV